MGTESGFTIFNSSPFCKAFERNLSGGIGNIQMLYRCNIMTLVGGGNNPKYSEKKVFFL
jgi:WD repeat-containing protein 45